MGACISVRSPFFCFWAETFFAWPFGFASHPTLVIFLCLRGCVWTFFGATFLGAAGLFWLPFDGKPFWRYALFYFCFDLGQASCRLRYCSSRLHLDWLHSTCLPTCAYSPSTDRLQPPTHFPCDQYRHTDRRHSLLFLTQLASRLLPLPLCASPRLSLWIMGAAGFDICIITAAPCPAS